MADGSTISNIPTLTIKRLNGDDVTITYKEGMTWCEWCESELNNTEFVCWHSSDGGNIHFGDGSPELLVNADFAGDYPGSQGNDIIKATDVISKDINYTTWWYD